MSAIGGKAGVPGTTLKSPQIAKSGYSPLSGVGIKDHLNLVIEFDLQVYFIAATNKARQGEFASRAKGVMVAEP
jgi:hypothetical protein